MAEEKGNPLGPEGTEETSHGEVSSSGEAGVSSSPVEESRGGESPPSSGDRSLSPSKPADTPADIPADTLSSPVEPPSEKPPAGESRDGGELSGEEPSEEDASKTEDPSPGEEHDAEGLKKALDAVFPEAASSEEEGVSTEGESLSMPGTSVEEGALHEETPASTVEKGEPKKKPEEREIVEEEEDYEFDLDGISLDDPSEAEEASPSPAEPEKHKAEAGPGSVPSSSPRVETWPEDEKEGKSLYVLLKEKFSGIPRRKIGVWAVLVAAPLLAVLLLGLPTKKIERIPSDRIPEAVPPRRPSFPEGALSRAVPGYIPPVMRRPLPPPAKDRPPLWAAAEQKARKGDYAGAIILLEKFLAGNPPLSPEEKSGAWYDLSRWYRKVGDKEASRRYFSMALDTTWSSLGPKDLFLGGLELHKAGKYRQARRYFAAFLLQEDLMVPELKKKISQAWFLLAEGYRLEAEAGEKAQERREEALEKAAGGGKGGKR